MTIEALRYHIDRLKALMDDPHPRLFTWQRMLKNEMEALIKVWRNE